MPDRVALVVTDAPPLITLAAARSLDYLLYPVLPVIIPDAVFFEETAVPANWARTRSWTGIASTPTRCE